MYERSAMQHTIFAPRRFSDANFDGSSFMRIRGKNGEPRTRPSFSIDLDQREVARSME
jgi:hypothetical protein